MAATYNVETAASVAGPWIVDQKGVRAMCCVFLSWLHRTTVHFPSTVLHCTVLYCTVLYWTPLGFCTEFADRALHR